MIEHSKKPADGELPNPGEVQVWLLDLSSACFQQLSSEQLVLSPEEEATARRFASAEVRHRYAITRTLVRKVLSHYRPSVPPLNWRFVRNGHGKPAIDAPVLASPLYYNVSHCQDRLALGISRWPATGVDIERLLSGRNTLGIARRYYSPQEFATLRDLAPVESLVHFYRLWTLKEAFSKALGGALVPSLSRLRIQWPEQGRMLAALDELPAQAGDWQFWMYAEPEHRLAVALQRPLQSPAVECRLRTISRPWQLDSEEMAGMVLESRSD